MLELPTSRAIPATARPLVLFAPGFNFDFLSRPTSQQIGWEECLRYDLFSVEWDVKH